MKDHDLDHLQHSVTNLRWLGLAALVVGIVIGAVVQSAVGSAQEGLYDEAERGRVVLIGWAIPLLFSGAVAACLFTIRKSVGVDLGGGRVWSDWRMLWFQSAKELEISPEGYVRQSEREVTNGRGKWTVHVVHYVTPEGSIELHRLGDRGECRRWAKRFARAIGAPLHESSPTVDDFIELDELDDDVVARDLARDCAWPARQASRRVRWDETRDGGVQVAIAPPGIGGTWVPLAVLVGGAFFVLRGTAAELRSVEVVDAAAWLWAAAMGAIGLGLALAAAFVVWQRCLRTQVVVADRYGVRRRDDPSSCLEASDVYQVLAPNDGSSVLVRSEGGALSLGLDLSREETEAVRDLVLLGLSGAAAPPATSDR